MSVGTVPTFINVGYNLEWSIEKVTQLSGPIYHVLPVSWGKMVSTVSVSGKISDRVKYVPTCRMVISNLSLPPVLDPSISLW